MPEPTKPPILRRRPGDPWVRRFIASPRHSGRRSWHRGCNPTFAAQHNNRDERRTRCASKGEAKMKTYGYTYQGALEAAERIDCRVEDLIGGDKRLDFSKQFMPE